jgi:hypothetical protein
VRLGETLTQVGIHASNSNDIFFLTNNVIPSNPYELPDIPFNTAYSHTFSHQTSNTYIPVNCAHLSQPPFQPPS